MAASSYPVSMNNLGCKMETGRTSPTASRGYSSNMPQLSTGYQKCSRTRRLTWNRVFKKCPKAICLIIGVAVQSTLTWEQIIQKWVRLSALKLSFAIYIDFWSFSIGNAKRGTCNASENPVQGRFYICIIYQRKTRPALYLMPDNSSTEQSFPRQQVAENSRIKIGSQM